MILLSDIGAFITDYVNKHKNKVSKDQIISIFLKEVKKKGDSIFISEQAIKNYILLARLFPKRIYSTSKFMLEHIGRYISWSDLIDLLRTYDKKELFYQLDLAIMSPINADERNVETQRDNRKSFIRSCKVCDKYHSNFITQVLQKRTMLSPEDKEKLGGHGLEKAFIDAIADSQNIIQQVILSASNGQFFQLLWQIGTIINQHLPEGKKSLLQVISREAGSLPTGTRMFQKLNMNQIAQFAERFPRENNGHINSYVLFLSIYVSWSHLALLLPIENDEMFDFYLALVIGNNLSVKQLKWHIQNRTFEQNAFKRNPILKLAKIKITKGKKHVSYRVSNTSKQTMPEYNLVDVHLKDYLKS